MFALVALFFLIAMLYAMVGFGGGSSYIAVLAVSSVSYLYIPKLSLICNLLVVSGGCYHFFRKGLVDRQLLLSFILSSAPMALVGGVYPLKEKTFFTLLIGSLFLCGSRLLFIRDRDITEVRPPALPIALTVGAILGLLSGMVGIGGGIFLSPLLMNLGWARSKNAAAVASYFIFINSVAGLAGQFIKSTSLPDIQTYWPLFIAVIVGGQIGSRIGTHTRVSFRMVQRGTGVLTLFIAGKLLFQAIL